MQAHLEALAACTAQKVCRAHVAAGVDKRRGALGEWFRSSAGRGEDARQSGKV